MKRVSGSGDQRSQRANFNESASPAQGHATEPGSPASPASPPRRLLAAALAEPPPLKRRALKAGPAADRGGAAPSLPLAPSLGGGLSHEPAVFLARRPATAQAWNPEALADPDADADAEVAFINSAIGWAPPALP